ncbi:MAG TPA: hypothetical protein ENK16_08035 [Chromatiales bacterium]|nr:hypothetical protein [Chromatiales bacterium]
MSLQRTALLFAVLITFNTALAASGENEDTPELRQEIEALKQDYESRIEKLEQRLDKTERQARKAERKAANAAEIAEDTAVAASSSTSAQNAFNPAIGAVLIASWADIGTGWDAIPGFMPGGELGVGDSGFSLGESELNLNSNVDAQFYANLTLALEDMGGSAELAIEEASIQTIALPHGLTIMGGRFFSGLGYLNAVHRHADDFRDAPLPYQAFLGGQYKNDGLQLRWVVPAPLFLELGGELNWGNAFPATSDSGSGPNAWTLFMHAGGDVGTSNSWKAGLSWLSADVMDRSSDLAPMQTFTGDSDLTVLDFVWKWAPGGNPTLHNAKLQGEYFWRDERGLFNGMSYDGSQTGWYVQGVWQFIPQWRVGYRHDQVDANNGPQFAGTLLQDPGRASKRDSVMLDWSYSEFSRIRLQYIRDRVLTNADNQYFIQYLVSIGAHGAHEF